MEMKNEIKSAQATESKKSKVQTLLVGRKCLVNVRQKKLTMSRIYTQSGRNLVTNSYYICDIN